MDIGWTRPSRDAGSIALAGLLPILAGKSAEALDCEACCAWPFGLTFIFDLGRRDPDELVRGRRTAAVEPEVRPDIAIIVAPAVYRSALADKLRDALDEASRVSTGQR